jgi:hypothetical protein
MWAFPSDLQHSFFHNLKVGSLPACIRNTTVHASQQLVSLLCWLNFKIVLNNSKKILS